MDSRSRQVAVEIVEAGLDDRAEAEAHLGEAFVALGDRLASAYVAVFARGLDSVQSDETGAAELRERIAADFHREAVRVVAAGVNVAQLAWQRDGKTAEEARQAAAWALRSSVAEEDLPWESEAELMAMAHTNYALAASEIYRLHKDEAATPSSGEFAEGILDNVVGFAIAAAASARAIEDQPT